MASLDAWYNSLSPEVRALCERAADKWWTSDELARHIRALPEGERPPRAPATGSAPKTADEVWAEVRAELDAMSAAFDGQPLSSLTRREQQLVRLGGVTGYRLAYSECADRLENAVIRGV